MTGLVPINQPGSSLYVNGAQLSWVSTTSISVQPGIVRDSTNLFDMNLGGYLSSSPVVTTINAAVNGVNGLDVGSLANNSFYAVFVIADQAGYNAPACLLSLSATAPTLPSGSKTLFPSGYSLIRRIGWVLTDGSAHILKFYQEAGDNVNRYMQYDAPISVLSAGVATAYTPVDLSVALPLTNFGRAVLYAAYTPNAVGDTAKFQPTGATADWHTISGLVATHVQDEQFSILPLVASSKPEISYKVSSASDALSLSVQGYVDLL